MEIYEQVGKGMKKYKSAVISTVEFLPVGRAGRSLGASCTSRRFPARGRDTLDREVLEVEFLSTFLGGFSTITHVYKRLSELPFFFLGSSRRALSGGKR